MWAVPSNQKALEARVKSRNKASSFDPLKDLDANEDDRRHDLPGDTAMTMGLTRIADIVCRKLLPWQAVCCPCAVETLRDLRFLNVQSQHEAFVLRMTQQLEARVLHFITKKDEEVDRWLQRESDQWLAAVTNDESGQRDLINAEHIRILSRNERHLKV
jgi:hypothetical protein